MSTENIDNGKSRKSRRYCAAVNCNNSYRNRPDLSYFRFPRDEERYRMCNLSLLYILQYCSHVYAAQVAKTLSPAVFKDARHWKIAQVYPSVLNDDN